MPNYTTFSHSTIANAELPEGYMPKLTLGYLTKQLGQNLLTLGDTVGDVYEKDWAIVIRGHEQDIHYYESGLAGRAYAVQYLATEARDKERDYRAKHPYEYGDKSQVWLYAN